MFDLVIRLFHLKTALFKVAYILYGRHAYIGNICRHEDTTFFLGLISDPPCYPPLASPRHTRKRIKSLDAVIHMQVRLKSDS